MHRTSARRTLPLLLLALLGFSTQALSESTHVAVAANFTAAARQIAEAFSEHSEHEAVLSFGSTGKLFTQIANGAPFEVFLAADQERPARAVSEGLAVAGTQFTYASGKLALFSSKPDLVDPQGLILSQPERFNKVAIANPKLAPYGIAAVEVMRALGLESALEPKWVMGENIAQTYQFVFTGNADLGFVALAQLAATPSGSHWIVPEDLYAPIHQDAVLLEKGADNPAARAFLDFLRGEVARGIIAQQGYGLN